MNFNNTYQELKFFNFWERNYAENNIFGMWLNKSKIMEAYILIID